jgi:hypothetical protein
VAPVAAPFRGVCADKRGLRPTQKGRGRLPVFPPIFLTAEKTRPAGTKTLSQQIRKDLLFSSLIRPLHELPESHDQPPAERSDGLPHGGGCLAFAVACVNKQHVSFSGTGIRFFYGRAGGDGFP